jgi:hypothetical protein
LVFGIYLEIGIWDLRVQATVQNTLPEDANEKQGARKEKAWHSSK